MYDAYLSEMEQMPADEEYLRRHRFSLGARPVRVLTTGNHGVGHLPRRRRIPTRSISRTSARSQRRRRESSSNSGQIFLDHSSEYLQFDQPDALLGVIREA